MIKKVLNDPWQVIVYMNYLGFFSWLPDKTVLRLMYRANMKKKLNLDFPVTFNEKLQWIKLYDHKAIYTHMVDKYLARSFIAERVGEEYLVPLLGVWDEPNQINFDKLPKCFVLKTNHDSGGVVICKNKATFDIVTAKKTLTKSLRRDYYKYSREWPYKDVPRKIICEQLLDNGGSELSDFKIHSFFGEPKFTLVCKDRHSATGMTEDFFDNQWNHLNIKRPDHPNATTKIERPAEFELMLELTRKLSKDIPFLRCDFYVVGHHVYCGELTFFPASGMHPFVPERWDEVIGSWLTLPKETSHEKSRG